jgi:hypothetical protein
MSGALCVIPPYAFMAWTGTTLHWVDVSDRNALYCELLRWGLTHYLI